MSSGASRAEAGHMESSLMETKTKKIMFWVFFFLRKPKAGLMCEGKKDALVF